jgi:hypothetical protein
MTYRVVVKKRVVVLEKPKALKDGMHVRVAPVVSRRKKPRSNPNYRIHPVGAWEGTSRGVGSSSG